jgi:pyrroloquinoline quinone (PQQ) biosynthesis protein C
MNQSIEKTLEDELSKTAEVIKHVPLESKLVYGNWLSQTYRFVCHSTRLLALASSRFELTQNQLHYRFVAHIREEEAHEVVALRDLAALGLSLHEFRECDETKAFYQAQYYWIEHVSPISFFGYILCLEGIAVQCGKSVFDRISSAFGPEAGNFLKLHSQEDQGHLKQALSQLEGLSPRDKGLVIENLEFSSTLYRNIFLRIASVDLKNNQKTAA